MSNYPSTPPWISASTAESQFRVAAFVRAVYAWMAGGLVLTTLAALWVATSPFMRALVLGNPFVIFIVAIAEIGIVIAMRAREQTITASGALTAFLVYSFLNGLLLSGVFVWYKRGSVVLAFAVSAGMYGATALYGLVTKRDLTSWGSFFRMGLFGLIILIVAGFFIHASALQLTIASLGIFIFLGLTAFHNQKIKEAALAPRSNTLAVYGALVLYLDFINIFLFVLQLLGDRNRQ